MNLITPESVISASAPVKVPRYLKANSSIHANLLSSKHFFFYYLIYFLDFFYGSPEQLFPVLAHPASLFIKEAYRS